MCLLKKMRAERSRCSGHMWSKIIKNHQKSSKIIVPSVWGAWILVGTPSETPMLVYKLHSRQREPQSTNRKNLWTRMGVLQNKFTSRKNICVCWKKSELKDRDVSVLGFGTADFAQSTSATLKAAEMIAFSQKECNDNLDKEVTKADECKRIFLLLRHYGPLLILPRWFSFS